MFQSIVFTTDGPLATIKLNRPQKLNAFGGSMREEIVDALDIVEGDDRIRVVVITGEGRGFSAGGDVEHLKYLRETNDEQGFRAILAKGQNVTRTMRSLPKPIIAAINGPCAGAGFSFALAADIRIASDAATFGGSFALIGLHPDWGGSWFLPKLVGTARACELFFSGAMISAQDALEMGLVNRAVPQDQLMPLVTELAGRISKNPPGVLRLVKESIYRSLTSDLETAFARETEIQLECFHTEDFLEGVTAFLQKRAPQFKGR